jgi:DNA-binding transcriptional regulator YhcF (GntR family)
MEFNEPKAIYLQIADFICENILTGEWKPDEKIPSVRQLAVMMEVNPNTTMRTFSYLQDQEIIYNKRGIGYFIDANGYEKTIDLMRRTFIETEVKPFLKKLKLLNITEEDLMQWYKETKQ